jgi:hypothetical protein
MVLVSRGVGGGGVGAVLDEVRRAARGVAIRWPALLPRGARLRCCLEVRACAAALEVLGPGGR